MMITTPIAYRVFKQEREKWMRMDNVQKVLGRLQSFSCLGSLGLEDLSLFEGHGH